jgi:MoaA/NifB/PqqE/SkfB family radical SAM enzyme
MKSPRSWKANVEYIARPWTFKIEMTHGCNLRCKFCPVFAHEKFQGNYKYMTPNRLRPIMKQLARLKSDGRIELTRRGEPTLNPHLEENIAIMREEMPKVQISLFSNGTTLLQKGKGAALIPKLLDAGLNIYNIDCYQGTYNKFKKVVQDSYPNQRLEDFRTFTAYKHHSAGHKLSVVNLVPDIADPKETARVRKLHNAAGNQSPEMSKKFGITPLTEPLAKKCAKPFRELNVNYDGKVPLCCEDWNEQCIIGDLTKNTAEEIWYGDFHLEILRSLYNKDRSGSPCDVCTFGGGHRLGFLQNPFERKK